LISRAEIPDKADFQKMRTLSVVIFYLLTNVEVSAVTARSHIAKPHLISLVRLFSLWNCQRTEQRTALRHSCFWWCAKKPQQHQRHYISAGIRRYSV